MEAILKVNNLVKFYSNNIVVNNVSFSLEKGKIYGLLGPNGAGKTTIMKLLANIIGKDDGMIEYEDSVKIKYLMDVPMFYEYMKVEEYLLFIIRLNRIENEEERLDYLLTISKLNNQKDKKIKELSRGLRQKLGIASVLVNDVDILILDEPVSALDPVGRKEVLDLIHSLKGKMCIIFSSHILVDIEKVCDHILLIHQGKIVVDGECQDIVSKKNYLLVKCENREQILLLKELYNNSDFSSNYENTIEVEFEDLISKQQEILKNAKKLGLVIEKLEVKQETLEEVFLNEVTKNE